MAVNQAELDRQARELYDRYHMHTVAPCFAHISLYDMLTGTCPKCGGIILAGSEITPERAQEMLATLKQRRRELGLSP